MAPRKAGKNENVVPQRSSARLRLKKQQDPSHVEGETSDHPRSTGQKSSSSKTLIGIESDTKTTALASSSIGDRRLTEAEEKEREVFDPAWSVSSPPRIHLGKAETSVE